MKKAFFIITIVGSFFLSGGPIAYAGPLDLFRSRVTVNTINPDLVRFDPLRITGTEGNDTIEIQFDFSTIKGFLNGTEIFNRERSICRRDEEGIIDFDAPPLPKIRIHGKGGNDVITVGRLGDFAECGCEISGGDGNDTISVAACNGGVISGNAGNDTIDTDLHATSLKIYGGPGNDTIDTASSDTQITDGGSGNDLFNGINQGIVIGGAGADDFRGIPFVVVCDATDTNVDVTAHYVFSNIPGGCSGACECTTSF